MRRMLLQNGFKFRTTVVVQNSDWNNHPTIFFNYRTAAEIPTGDDCIFKEIEPVAISM